MRCGVCSAPELGSGVVCHFCRSPLPQGEPSDPDQLVAYLAERLPGARVRRSLFRRRVRRVATVRGGTAYSVRPRPGGLKLRPNLEPGDWVESLLEALGREAAADPDLRKSVTRAGWSLRSV